MRQCAILVKKSSHHGLILQGSKLTLANSRNASDFDNLRVRKISTSKRLRVRIINVSHTKGKNLLDVSLVASGKNLTTKLCHCTKKLTWSPVTLKKEVLLKVNFIALEIIRNELKIE